MGEFEVIVRFNLWQQRHTPITLLSKEDNTTITLLSTEHNTTITLLSKEHNTTPFCKADTKTFTADDSVDSFMAVRGALS